MKKKPTRRFVVCINNDFANDELTLRRVYEVLSSDQWFYGIEEKEGDGACWYQRKFFSPITLSRAAQKALFPKRV